MKAYVFPGQGAQFVGMGKDLYENNSLAKEMFEKGTHFNPVDLVCLKRLTKSSVSASRI